MSFYNKVVLITGGSSGIGAATAEQFAAEGAKISIVGRNTTRLAEVSEKCERNGSKPLVIVADLCKDDDIRRVVETTIQTYKKLDILVNCAGICYVTCILDYDAMKNFDHTIAINLRAPIYLTNVAVPYIVQSKGNIVNISSIGAETIIQHSGTFAYCASKSALNHFTRSIAKELAHKGVRVNAINPGPVKTNVIKNMGVDNEKFEKKFWARAKEFTALERISEPEEIANLVLYLASEKARGITGSIITSDNGFLLKKLAEY